MELAPGTPPWDHGAAAQELLSIHSWDESKITATLRVHLKVLTWQALT